MKRSIGSWWFRHAETQGTRSPAERERKRKNFNSPNYFFRHVSTRQIIRSNNGRVMQTATAKASKVNQSECIANNRALSIFLRIWFGFGLSIRLLVAARSTTNSGLCVVDCVCIRKINKSKEGAYKICRLSTKGRSVDPSRNSSSKLHPHHRPWNPQSSAIAILSSRPQGQEESPA